MNSIFDKLVSALEKPLSGFGINSSAGVVASISKNISDPIGRNANTLKKVFGSEDEFLSKYENFHNVYKRALTKELDSTAISTAQRRMIQAAIDAPVINLNLIRNVQQRQSLISMMRNQILDVDAMVQNFGAPGVAMPSSNLYRASTRYLVDSKSGSNHPALALINSLSFNIDPTKTGSEAFGFGKSNLPSFNALRNATEKSKSLSKTGSIFKANTKILTFDVETSGLGVYDQVRSLAASTMEVQNGGVIRHNADGFSTHFITPQMEQYSMGGTSGSTTRLGTAVYREEKAAGDLVADLTTAQGRREAVSIYKKFFKQATEADIIAGHNVQFDVQRIMMSVSGIDEFYQDKEAVQLLKKFQDMTDSGKVINSLDIARDYLTRQALEAAELAGGDEAAKIQKMVSTMFAPETLARASIGGSATPFSVGNIAGQTNLLELIESKGGLVGSNIISDLAGGSHRANVDTVLTNFMMQFIHTGELKFGFDTLNASAGVNTAREAILKASAITPTTNIANVQHMSDAVYKFAMSDEGIKGAKMSTDKGIIAFSQGDFYEHVTDKVTGQVSENKLIRANVANDIRTAIDASRRGDPTDLIDTGITYAQASRVDSILNNVSKITSLSKTTSPQDLISALSKGNTGVEDAFIDALAGTREFLGFNNYQYRPEILTEKGMTNLMSQSFGMISSTDADNYLKKLASAGIATAVDDPFMRRNFVELATITSSLPFANRPDQYTGGFASNIVRKIAAKAGGTGPLSLSEHAARVSDFNANVGVRVGEYLSEIGVSFADAQTSNYLVGKGGISRPSISADILKDIDVTIRDSTGASKKVKFLSQEFLADYKTNKFGLSINERESGKFVNLVFGNLAGDASAGNAVVNRRTAIELASGIVEKMQANYMSMSLAELVEKGHFENEQQAGEVLARLRGERQGGVKAFRKEIARAISDRGLTVGSIGGREAEGVVSLLEQIAGGIDNDTIAFQKGMQFAISEYGDDFVAFQGRIDDKVLAVLKQSNPALAKDVEEGTFLRKAYETYQTSMQRAAEDTGFRKRLQRAFSSKGLDKGIFGSRFGRGLRDAEVRAAYKKIAPKVGIGVAAVGLLSAGYYIAKKNRTDNLYDEVMREQPLEGRGFVAESNNETIQSYPQSSTRRDPLVTAGVVGNLDRNKIGHTGMGPKKYDHLYR